MKYYFDNGEEWLSNMTTIPEINTIKFQEGWMCPKCGRIMAPTTPWCYFCSSNQQPTITSTTGSQPPPLTKTISITNNYDKDMQYVRDVANLCAILEEYK